MEIQEKKPYFHRKVYKLDQSPISNSFRQEIPETSSSCKKIIATTPLSGLRESYKKIFLPLLIEVFELRQMAENWRTQKETDLSITLEKIEKSPSEILDKLEEMKCDVEESQRWCNSLLLQLEKAIQEAQKLPGIKEKVRETKLPLLKKLLFWRDS